MYFLYSIENRLTNTLYIGKSKNPKNRWIAHKLTAKNEDGAKTYHKCVIHHAIKKYGVDNFDFQVFAAFSSETECYAAEQYWIEYLRHSGIKLYNILDGGLGLMSGEKHPGFGIPRTDEVKRKLSENHKGKFTGNDNPNFGNKMSVDSRKRISDARKESILSNETRIKISVALLSKTPEERNVKRGENQPNAILKEIDVIEIKKMIKNGTTAPEIGRKFGVHKNTIQNIKNGSNWKHVKV